MKMQTSRRALAALCLGTLAALAFAYAPWQQTATADEDQDRVVDITAGRSDEQQGTEVAEEPAHPAYWIGIQGHPVMDEVLRTQLQLADDVGVVVYDVVADSPAAKAGLRKHDVLIAVNGDQITDMKALQKVVADNEAKPLELKVIRLAKETTVKVTPEKAPADLLAATPAEGQGGFEFGAPQINDLLKQFDGSRKIGPGMLLNGQQFDLSQMPNNVSVQINREGDGPAKITVKKGDETWTVEGDDKEAIKKLPEDLRPFVQQMLRGGRSANLLRPDFNIGELQGLLPDQLGRFDGQLNGEAVRGRAQKSQEEMLRQMDQMRKRLDEMRRQLEEQRPAAGEEVQHDRST